MSIHNLRTETMRPGDVYVGRPTHRHVGNLIEVEDGYFGNPFVVGRDGDRAAVIAKFEAEARDRIERDPEYRDRVRALAGKRLFCYCAPLPCHGDVLERLSGELAGVEGTEREGAA